ncbi:hypothetical protein PC116_g33857 [Phytophthora cactorum]|nr:hypothetical protein PC116_g33857 [Phytophthora cactorum]
MEMTGISLRSRRHGSCFYHGGLTLEVVVRGSFDDPYGLKHGWRYECFEEGKFA